MVVCPPMYYLMLLTVFLPLSSFSSTSAVCGEDNRTPHYDRRIGRIRNYAIDSNCTASMISKNCALTAGHCVHLLSYVEFEVGNSVDGQRRKSSPENVFQVEKYSIVSKEQDLGRDWAIFRLRSNKVTHKAAGDKGHFEIDFNGPQLNDEVSVAGFGRDKGIKNYTLQSATGLITSLDSDYLGKILTHSADTSPGVSGAAIIRVSDQKIVGLHTTSGCDWSHSGNIGTIINEDPELVEAIINCISKY
jgi:V8-like Glu-specific endopeptidase